MEVSVARWAKRATPLTSCSPLSAIGLRHNAFWLGHRGQRSPSDRTIDKSGANTAGIESYNVEHDTAITIRQCKYLNNIVEQDHRAVKRIIRPMLGFKSFGCARIILGGIEIMHMIRKGQMRSNSGSGLSAAEQFYSLAA